MGIDNNHSGNVHQLKEEVYSWQEAQQTENINNYVQNWREKPKIYEQYLTESTAKQKFITTKRRFVKLEAKDK